MITNERQYQITKRKVRSFRQAIEQFDAQGGERNDIHPRIRQAEREAMESQLEDLRSELAEYDRLKAANPSIVAKADTHYVVPNPNGGWDVTRGGSTRASSHHNTKRAAIYRARKISRNQGTELRIHNKDGKISDNDSYGNGPLPRRQGNRILNP